MVPAPTSTSCGCCRMQPCSAQKFCRRRMSSWKVSGFFEEDTVSLSNSTEIDSHQSPASPFRLPDFHFARARTKTNGSVQLVEHGHSDQLLIDMPLQYLHQEAAKIGSTLAWPGHA